MNVTTQDGATWLVQVTQSIPMADWVKIFVVGMLILIATSDIGKLYKAGLIILLMILSIWLKVFV